VDEVILGDDDSSDDTVALARELSLHLVWHPHNVGYGGNKKTCYTGTRRRSPSVPPSSTG
jgi:glycosyltransferase involved in cell wall biosynthesis